MSDDEPILLHEQDLMLGMLRAAEAGPAKVRDAVAWLSGLRAEAGEPSFLDEENIGRLHRAARALLAAGALRVEPDRLGITGRGRELLASSPEGVDETMLMRFPEFRASSPPRATAPRATTRALPPSRRGERLVGGARRGVGLSAGRTPDQSRPPLRRPKAEETRSRQFTGRGRRGQSHAPR